MLYLRKEYFSLLGGTYNGSCILQGYVDEKRLKTPDLDNTDPRGNSYLDNIYPRHIEHYPSPE